MEGTVNYGIYYMHYTHDRMVHLYSVVNILRSGTVQISHKRIHKDTFEEIKIIKRAEEFTSLSDAVKYLRRNYDEGDILY